MEKLSIEEFNKLNLKDKCIHMWEWVVENPDKEKEDFFTYMGIPYKDQPASHCYACEYVRKLSPTAHLECKLCPVDWAFYEELYAFNEDDGICERHGSPYQDWVNNHYNNYLDDEEYNERVTYAAKEVLECVKRTWKVDDNT